MTIDLLSTDVPPKRCDLPIDAQINAEIVVTSYFDSNGKLRYGTHLAGSVNLAQAVGLTELAKGSIIEWYQETVESQDEEDDDGDR